MTVTEIVLARHGEAWIARGGGPGSPESLRGLSRQGLRHAQHLAQRLAAEARTLGEFAAVYTSPSLRALETCTPVSNLLGMTAKVAHPLRPSEAEARCAVHALAAPASGAVHAWPSYVERAGAFLLRLPLTHPGTRLVVVGHGVTQRAAMTAFLRLPTISGWWDAPLDWGGISRWIHRCDERSSSGVWSLAAHNDVSHLHPAGEVTPSTSQAVAGESADGTR